ncbi:DUF6457 domain-containing protein [uncultured Friedmanniella sp.]|uniref:DUF6457 domain-containing protein n=1 Tax=uncultured Friedmanniella sp. TaxID=335381 RepID=UPI0035CB7CE7
MDLPTWLAAVARELGVEDVQLDEPAVATLLALAGDAAHGVERVAAPLTTFLAGVAVGRGAELAATAAGVVALLDEPA